MSGYFTPPDIPRLTTSSAQHNPLDSPGPSSAPPTFHGPRFEASSLPTFVVNDGPMSAAKNPRVRRKSISGVEQVKHRRTRSGCFTCRTRRVKCDETHPVCERCQKGGRECTYPEVIPPSKPSSSRKRTEIAVIEESSSGEDNEQSKKMQHAELRRDTWPTLVDNGVRTVKSRKGSSYEPSPSPNMDGNFNFSESSAATSPANSIRRTISHTSLINTPYIGRLPQEEQFYLNFHIQNVTPAHYLMKGDCDNFFQTTLIEHALKYEPLLYAVIAFSSLHYSVKYQTGRLQTFLSFYDKSIGLLRARLHETPTISTLITVLQLASFEEFLGDWCNIMQHHEGALKIVASLYTPESMMETSEGRLLYEWFSRFDIYAAMIAGHSTTIDRIWCVKNREWHQLSVLKEPKNIQYQLGYATASLRDLAMDLSLLVTARAQGTMEALQFEADSANLRRKYSQWWQDLDPALLADPETVPAPIDGSIEEPFLPAQVYKGSRWAFNYLLLDYYGLIMLINYHTPPPDAGTPSMAMREVAIECSKLLSAISTPDLPSESLLPAQAAVGLVALWLPATQSYREWVRRKLAKVEENGYIFPSAYRKSLALLWGEPEVEKNWLKTPSEKTTSDMIRQLVDSRSEEDMNTPATDTAMEELREMRALLANLNLNSSSNIHSPATATTDSNVGSPEQTNTASQSIQGTMHADGAMTMIDYTEDNTHGFNM